jgi:hypothetical protein
MPIGSNAVYVAANIETTPTFADVDQVTGQNWTSFPIADENVIVMHPESTNLIPLYFSNAQFNTQSNGQWVDRCPATLVNGAPKVFLNSMPWPVNYFLPSQTTGNAVTSVLMSDGHTIQHFGPTAKCQGYSYATAGYFDSPADIFGDSNPGKVYLHFLGGALRVGELTKANGAPKHALSITIDAYDESYCIGSNPAICERWPEEVTSQDISICPGSEICGYGLTKKGGTPDTNPSVNKSLKMGALLAIPKNMSIVLYGANPPPSDATHLYLETQPAQMLAWTFQNYGGYTDDTIDNGIGFATENGPDGEFTAAFRSEWGFDFEGRVFQRTDNSANSAWLRDVARIFSALNVVDNNGPDSIGGGGTPLQPLTSAQCTVGPQGTVVDCP